MSEDINFQNVSIILPAYNEAASIGKIVEQSIKATEGQAEIIVIDDGSVDMTASIARDAGAIVIKHPYNKGNGAAVKTGVRSSKGDILVLLDSDGQHDPVDIPSLIRMIDRYDLVIGTRSFKGRNSLHRNIANRFYRWLASYLTEQKILDLTSGFRAFRRKPLLKFLHLFPNRYSYPTTSTLSFIKTGLNVGFCPVKTLRRESKSQVRIFRDGLKFFLIIFKIIVLFHPFRVFFPISVILFILGLISGFLGIQAAGRLYIPNSATILFVTAVIVSLLGLDSAQITSLKMDNLENMEFREKQK